MAEEYMLKCLWKHRVYTSTAYRYWNPAWSEDENRNVYGEDASPDGVGYNLVVEAKLDSELMTEEAFRSRLYDTSRLIDHKFLNDEISEFQNQAVTLERIALYLKEQMATPGVQFRLTETGRCSVETAEEGLILTVYGKFNAVHRHWNPDLAEAENRKLYGKCSGLHGHEYKLEYSVKGSMDSKTFLVDSRSTLLERLESSIIKPLHGSYLNDHIGNTSGEKISRFVAQRLSDCSMTQQPHRIVLRETRKNSFKVGSEFF